MTQHTQGPWEVHESAHVDGEYWASIGHNGRGPITDIVGSEGNKSEYYIPVAGMKYLVTPVEQQKANAALIAAAPDLLEALKSTIQFADKDGYLYGKDKEGRYFYVDTSDIKDAIAKATVQS